MNTYVKHLQMAEAGRADVAAVGLVGAVADQVNAELALGGLGRGVPVQQIKMTDLDIEYTCRYLHNHTHTHTHI